MTASSPARTPGRGRGQGRDTDGFDDEDDCHLRDEDEREVLFVNDVGSFDDMDPEETARKRRRTDAIRYTSFACAILSCLCAGSITAYSLYAPLFLTRLRYTQIQVNAISSAAELAMYLPVPLWGYMCDRHTPRPASFLSAVLFGSGYLIAALTYRSGPPASAGGTGHSFPLMVIAFTLIGLGTTAMYISAVTTCAKNFGRGSHKGFALAAPIAAFGLSGLWQSQLGSHLLSEPQSGQIDAFRYFIFLCITLSIVGCIGGVALKVVDEASLISDAVSELERSGMLEESGFFQPLDRSRHSTDFRSLSIHRQNRSPASLTREAEEWKSREEEEQRKKTWLLNGETRRFLSDHTTWWLAAGFFLVTGPGEAFINNLGSIISSLSPPPTSSITEPPPTSPATHISIIALTSTFARILTGLLSDRFAPASSPAVALPVTKPHSKKPFTLSRIPLLLASLLLLLTGQLLLASHYPQNHAGSRFWPVSALIGFGYGAIFSLVPILVSVVWGLENFGTNWGLIAMCPALAATLWGTLFATLYERGTSSSSSSPAQPHHAHGSQSEIGSPICYGPQCYSPVFAAMAAASILAALCWVFAWKGWRRRGIVV